MDIRMIGEFGLINLLKENTVINPETVVTGIGDDAAVLLPTPGYLQLITADMLVETVHFDRRFTTARQLGNKAIAVNVSDIAAMGGTPRHAVISIALPAVTNVEYIVELYGGMKEVCREFGVNIVGGDTVSSPDKLVINVTLTGEVPPDQVVRRSGAQPGDLVVTTGTLGDSAAGLDWLLHGEWQEHPAAEQLVAAHLTPRPQAEAGRYAAAAGATAMDDISDGLASEANEIAGASQAGIIIYADKIPFSEALIATAAFFGKDPLEYALFGGEDYQLLFTIPPNYYKKLKKDTATRYSVVGEVTGTFSGVCLIDRNGVSTSLEPKGYNHFR